SAKRLELLRQAVPGLSRVTALWNPDIRGAVFDYKETESAARLMGLELQSVEVSRAEDLDRAFSAVTKQRAQALVLPVANPGGFRDGAQSANFRTGGRAPGNVAQRRVFCRGVSVVLWPKPARPIPPRALLRE